MFLRHIHLCSYYQVGLDVAQMVLFKIILKRHEALEL